MIWKTFVKIFKYFTKYDNILENINSSLQIFLPEVSSVF